MLLAGHVTGTVGPVSEVMFKSSPENVKVVGARRTFAYPARECHL